MIVIKRQPDTGDKRALGYLYGALTLTLRCIYGLFKAYSTRFKSIGFCNHAIIFKYPTIDIFSKAPNSS